MKGPSSVSSLEHGYSDRVVLMQVETKTLWHAAKQSGVPTTISAPHPPENVTAACTVMNSYLVMRQGETSYLDVIPVLWVLAQTADTLYGKVNKGMQTQSLRVMQFKQNTT